MKHTTWILAVMAILVATAAPARADDEEIPTLREMERQERHLELKSVEAELEHEQKMRELELQERRAEIQRKRYGHWKRHRKHRGGCLLLIAVINILLTVWVCKDMREQKIGRALWVPIVLLAGVFGAIIYAIARNADMRARAGESD